MGYAPWGCEGSDTTEATFTFSYLPAFRDCPAQNSNSTPSTPWSSSPALLVYTYLLLLWLLSCVPLFETLQTVARQVPLSIGFFRQEYWSGVLFPSPGDLPHPGTNPRSPALQADALPSEPPEKPKMACAAWEKNPGRKNGNLA